MIFRTKYGYEITIKHYFCNNKSVVPQNVDMWLYKGLTAYYRSKYPETNVKAVIIRYVIKN